MLGTKEHYEAIAQFDRDFKSERLDKEPKALWKQGIVYQDGKVNQLFDAYLRGYSYHKCLSHQD